MEESIVPMNAATRKERLALLSKLRGLLLQLNEKERAIFDRRHPVTTRRVQFRLILAGRETAGNVIACAEVEIE